MVSAARSVALVLACVGMSSCKNVSQLASSEDSTVSGVAAGSVGGALAGSSSAGTSAQLLDRKQNLFNLILPKAMAGNSCPSILSTGSSCASSGTGLDLTYSDCSFGNSSAVWNGTLNVSLASGTLACGTFPSLDSAVINRVYVSSGSTAGQATRSSPAGTLVTIDDATTGLGNFDSDSITGLVAGGYGSQVSFNSSGERTGVVIQHHLSSSFFDHSVSGSLSVSEAGSTRTVTGTVSTYHNKLKLVGSSVFNSVTYNDSSCYPFGGSIITTFSAGSNVSPDSEGSSWVGQSETLSFEGAGLAKYTDPTGKVSVVALTHCY